MKLNNKHKSKIRREIDLELKVSPPKSSVFVDKKKYKRKFKHKEMWKNNNNEQTKQKIIRKYKKIK